MAGFPSLLLYCDGSAALASFAGEGTSFAGTAFLKSYVGICLEVDIIVLACLIFSAFMSSSSPIVDTSLSAVPISWQYIGKNIFKMLGADRIDKRRGKDCEGDDLTIKG